MIIESPRSIADKLSRAEVADLNEATNVATEFAGATLAKTATGFSVESETPGDTVWTQKCADNFLPINYRSIWSDFGGGNETDSHGWNYNALGEDPNAWGMSMTLETPFDGVMEYWWSMQAPTAGAFANWRSMVFSVIQATAISDLKWGFDITRWYANPNINDNIDAQFTIDTENERIFTTVAFGIGASPRDDENGPMFNVTGSSGTGLEFIRINPTAMADNASAVYMTLPANDNCNAYWSVADIAGDFRTTLQNTNATGNGQFLVWTIGGNASCGFLTTLGNWSAGVEGVSGDYLISNSYLVGTNPAFRIAKTTLEAIHYGPLSFNGTNHAGVRLNSLTTTERDLLTPVDGDTILNVTDGKVQSRVAGAWVDLH